jgi:hypothetical protein
VTTCSIGQLVEAAEDAEGRGTEGLDMAGLVVERHRGELVASLFCRACGKREESRRAIEVLCVAAADAEGSNTRVGEEDSPVRRDK